MLGESVTVTTITDTSVELTLGIRWQIARAATKTLAFQLPERLADVFDFNVPGLRQLESNVENGVVTFTIHLQQPVSESFFIVGLGTLPLPDSRQVNPNPPQLVVTDDSRASLTGQSHFWVVVNQSEGVLAAVKPETDGSDVDPSEIQTQIPEGFLQQAVAIRRLRSEQPNSPWELQFPEKQQVAPAVIALAEHVTVIASDATWRSKHTLQVRNESRQFLPIFIPDGCRIMYCLVGGQPARVVSRTEGDRTLYLIPAPQSGEVSTPVEVQFAISGQLENLADAAVSTSIQIPCIDIPEYRDFPEFGVTVSRNTWKVYVPESWSVSALNNPRQTNVISATLQDFEDFQLMCAVDNMNSLINSVKSRDAIRDNRKALQELQSQSYTLQTLSGNGADILKEQAAAIQKAEALLQQQQQQSAEQFELIEEYLIPGTKNVFLDNNDAVANSFNKGNGLNLLMQNSIDGITVDKNLKFNFELPETLDEKFQAPAAISGKQPNQSKRAAGKKSEPQTAKPRSQLLQRRYSKDSQNKIETSGGESDILLEGANQSFGVTPSFGSRLAFPQQPQSGLQAISSFETTERKSPSQGLLSLNFQIPEHGVRHDFIRTTGNPVLTLRIRDSQTARLGYGVLWAGGCLVFAMLFLGGTSGKSSLFRRSLLMLALLGLAGWFLTTDPIRSISGAVSLASAILFCIAFSVKSLQRQSAQ